VWQVARANQPPFTDPLTWTIVPLAVIVPFACRMEWLAEAAGRPVAQTADAECSDPVVMGPSIGRLPIAPPAPGTVPVLGRIFLFVPLILWDSRTRPNSSGNEIRIAMAALCCVSTGGLLAEPSVGKVAAHFRGLALRRLLSPLLQGFSASCADSHAFL
jgi:hypothetical protein